MGNMVGNKRGDRGEKHRQTDVCLLIKCYGKRWNLVNSDVFQGEGYR